MKVTRLKVRRLKVRRLKVRRLKRGPRKRDLKKNFEEFDLVSWLLKNAFVLTIIRRLLVRLLQVSASVGFYY